jgi:glycosyltransferase involved in cell wall biosynthesis
MRVLLLTQVLPYPPDSGPTVKTWNVVKYLTRHHEVTLASFVRGDQSAAVRILGNYCHTVHTVTIQRGLRRDMGSMLRSLLTNQPFLMIRDDRAAMRQLVNRLAVTSGFDVVHADQLNMAPYATRIPHARKVLDAHNALWILYKRLWQTMPPGLYKWLLGRDWRLLRTYEGRLCRQFDAVLTVSREDCAALEEVMGKPSAVSVIPIAIDPNEVVPVPRQPGADRLLFIGTMYWPPNIDGVRWFLREVYPCIRAQRPDVTVDILGARPPRDIVAMAKDGTGINIAGYVADPTSYVQRAALLVVPLRAGGGMRVKILNALAQGLPVVSTRLGCEGIAAEAGRHLLIADTPEEFAQATLRLLADRPLADELGRNGRRLIQSTYDYRVVCQALDDVYRSDALLFTS